MHLSSRQIGAALPTSLLAEVQSVVELKSLVLPAARSRYSSDPAIGPQGKWLLEALRSLRTLLYVDPELSMIATLGGEPWRAALEGIAELLVEAQLGHLLVGRVSGDRLEERIETLLRDGIPLRHASSGDSLNELANPIVSARVALGAAPYVHAVAEGCRFVLGGEASPGALAMGRLFDQLPLVRNDWNVLATSMLYAVIVERFSLDLYVADDGKLHLSTGGDPMSTADMEQRIRSGLMEMEPRRHAQCLSLPEVTINWQNLAFEWQPHGGIDFKGIAGDAPAEELLVDVVYALGVQSHLVALIQDTDAPRRATDLAALVHSRFPPSSNPFARRGAWTSIQQDGQGELERVRLAVHLHGGDAEEIASLYREIYAFMATQPQVEIESPLLPAVSTHFEQWPTTVPRDAIEWEVEIRAARDWV